MKKLLLIAIGCFIINFSHAQWNDYCYFDINFFPSSYSSFEGADFINKDTGMYWFYYYFSPSSGSGHSLRCTNDGGNNWVSSYGNGTYSNLNIFSVRNQGTFYCIDNSGAFPYRVGSLLKSLDGGVSWILLYSQPTSIGNFSAPDSNHLYFLRFTLSMPYTCYLAKYENGILNDTLADLTSIGPIKIFFPDTIVGYANRSNSIFKTMNGGVNWNLVFTDSLRNIKDMFFVNANIGYVVCDSGKIIKTINGGATWQNVNSVITMNSIFFINDSTGFAAGDSGVIIRTTNGGSNWNQDSTPTQSSFLKIFFVNDSIGFAVIDQWMFTINLRESNSIWESLSLNGINIFPNPTNSKLTIESATTATSYELYDITGKLFMHEAINTKRFEIDLSNYSSGIYFLTVGDKEKQLHRKIVKE